MNIPKIPLITRISKNVIRILGSNPSPMTLQGTNTYLIGSGSERILVDTGDENIPEYISSLRLVLNEEKARIRDILLTHWHHDHVGGVKDVLKINNNEECKVWKFPRYSNEPQSCPEIPDHVKIHQLVNGQQFSVEGATMKVVHTPGHTSDHVCLLMNEILFSGDCILGEGTAVFEDLSEYVKSLELLLHLNSSTIYPAHGNIVLEAKQKIEFYLAHRKQREEDILKVFRMFPEKMFSAMDIVKEVYKETPENLWLAAAHNVTLVLKKLGNDKKIVFVKDEDDGPAWRLNGEGSRL
ncbi:LACTB2 family protein [Megaselia abdita]